MTEHTLAILIAIFTLLHFAYLFGIGVSDKGEDKNVKALGLVFSLPASIFTIWLVLSILF